MSDRRKDMARVFKALCNEYRLQAVELLRTGERCASDLQHAIGISQPNLSHHMKVLMNSGIVVARQEGKKTLYSISEAGVLRARGLLANATDTHDVSTRESMREATRRIVSKGTGPGSPR